MAQFLLNYPVSRMTLSWMSDIYIPDEAFYATMMRMRVDQQDHSFHQEMGSQATETAFCLTTR